LEETLPNTNHRQDPSSRTKHGFDIESFAESHYGKVFKYFRFRGLDTDDANDLTSSVFERAISKQDRYDPSQGAPCTWLFTIARNMLNNHWRHEALRKTMPLVMVEGQQSDDPLPEEAAVRKEARKELLHALGSLDERDRDLIGLKFSALMTNREIAELTGLTEGNVGVILYRALRKLKSLLTPIAGGCG
jgi:RNA polymerase sigma factor (sigma-70 family)